MDNRPIGVFDSGLGGLTGVRELRKRLPHEDIIYFGDTGRVPYGSRSPETILQYARQDVAFLLSKNVKCIMAACGTVSSTYPAAEEEKEEFVELMTRGSFVLKGGSYYVTYRETETTGYEGCTTTLKIAADGSRVAMLRFGKGGGAGTQLLIEKGRRNLCHYETGFGSMTLGVTADEIDCQLTEKGGTARFAYLLDADSAELVSRNRLEVTVTHVN
jgi:uncharacterized beta-barrel protein YwiB (DUF1934 family)